jgi:ABC-2 type transport system ATP-binding protein
MAVLAVSHLSKRYRSGTLANDDLDLSIARGEVYGLLGPNGAGKTTLVRQVLGLLRPTSGTIAVEGVDIVANPAYARRNIGFLPQGQFHMDGARVGEMIEGVARLRGLRGREAKRRTERLVEQLDLGPFLGTSLMAASGGVQRLAGFATAVVGAARFLVLDEPTNDVDPVRRQLLWNVIAGLRREGTTVLLVTHNLAEAERVLDRFAIIDRGRILLEGTPAGLRTLVTDRLRLEMTLAGPVEPHPALEAEPGEAAVFLLDPEHLQEVSGWLAGLRASGNLLDFRIGPPSLEDIYHAAVNGSARRVAEVA